MLNRRNFLLRGATLAACSAAAHPLMTTVTLAASDGRAPLGDHRLVVIILRGAMDGLDVVQPRGDANYARLRPNLSKTPGLDLDGYFQMHRGLEKLMPMWTAGELAFVHATATPYRDKRSHFTGQDQLEAGTGLDVPLEAIRDGWLNRLLQAVPGVTAETAYAVGLEEMKVLAGPAPFYEWTPDTKLSISPQARLLFEHVYHDDPLFLAAASEAMELGTMMQEDGAMGMGAAGELAGLKLDDVDKVVAFAAGRLKEDSRIAAFSLTGWDTHKVQGKNLGRALTRLERAILQLQKFLGPEVWGKTTVMAMTEFGRTVAENGTGGTDHGTGGAVLVAGGAVAGGKVYGRFPGLDEAALYERRDLMPTSDVRGWAAHAMRGLYGLDRAVLEGKVFPGLQMGDDPGLIRG